MARPRKQIDPEQVEQLAQIGCPTDEIAAVLGVNERTIERRFVARIKSGHHKLKTNARSMLVKKAKSGDTACIIFLAKTVCGMKEYGDTVINVSATATGGHITISDEQKKELSRMAHIIRRQVLTEARGNSNGPNGDPASN
jgi:DNA-binding CsgD family transcriptional regulator